MGACGRKPTSSSGPVTEGANRSEQLLEIEEMSLVLLPFDAVAARTSRSSDRRLHLAFRSATTQIGHRRRW